MPAQTCGGIAVTCCIAALPKRVSHDSVVENENGKLGPLALVLRLGRLLWCCSFCTASKVAMLTDDDRTLRPEMQHQNMF